MGMVPVWQPLPREQVLSLPPLLLLTCDTQMQQANCCPIQSLLFSRQLYCKGTHLLPPTANFPLHLYGVLMINKNKYGWITGLVSFIHSACESAIKIKGIPWRLIPRHSASFLQARSDWHKGINISIHGVYFHTVSICQAKYCKTSKTLIAPLKLSSACAQSLGWGWIGRFWVLFIYFRVKQKSWEKKLPKVLGFVLLNYNKWATS